MGSGHSFSNLSDSLLFRIGAGLKCAVINDANYKSCLNPDDLAKRGIKRHVMQTIAVQAALTKRKAKQKPAFDAQAFLDSAGEGNRVVEYRRSQKIYSQGDPTTGVMYIQKGSVTLSVVNEGGKEAVVAILGPGDFLGEECLTGRPIYLATATTIAPTTVLVIEKRDGARAP